MVAAVTTPRSTTSRGPAPRSTTSRSLLVAIPAHVTAAGGTPAAVRATRSWAAIPSLAGHPTPAGTLAAARHGGPAVEDTMLVALLAAGGEWAEVTALAVLAPRLGWIVAGWARHGATIDDVRDLEADLVAAALDAFRAARAGPPPDRPGLVLVDRAWAPTRNRRVTDVRRARRQSVAGSQPAADQPAAAAGGDGDGRSGVELLAAAVCGEVAGGRIGVLPARAIYLTRVAGYDTTETAARLATTAGSVRTQRARAARHLANQLTGALRVVA